MLASKNKINKTLKLKKKAIPNYQEQPLFNDLRFSVKRALISLPVR